MSTHMHPKPRRQVLFEFLFGALVVCPLWHLYRGLRDLAGDIHFLWQCAREDWGDR